MPGERFTTWLDEQERETLRAVAEHSCSSQNIIVRFVLRAVLLDKPLPQWLKEAITEVTELTKVTHT